MQFQEEVVSFQWLTFYVKGLMKHSHNGYNLSKAQRKLHQWLQGPRSAFQFLNVITGTSQSASGNLLKLTCILVISFYFYFASDK